MSGPQVQRTTTGSIFNATSDNYSNANDRNVSFSVSESKVTLLGRGANTKVEYSGFADPDGTDVSHPVTYGWFLQNKTSSFIGHARARTTENLAATYDNGASGVGATLTGSANGALASQDGVALAAGDILLVMDQTAQAQNGRYEVTQLGDAGSAFILTRTVDCDEAAEFINATVPVSEGTLYADTNWQCTANAGLTLGTGAVQFVQFGATVADGAITTAKLADDAVTSAKLGPDSVLNEHVADDQIDSEHIVAGALDAEHFSAQSVETAAIADANVTTAKLAANAVNSSKLADNAVEAAKIQDGAVTAGKLSSDAVTTLKIQDDAVTTAKIVDNAITSAKIAPGAVERLDIADNAIGSAQIENGQVGSDELAVNSVVEAKIADGAVAEAKIGTGAVSTAKLGADAVTDEKIADNAVRSEHIQNAAVGTSQLADGSVTTAKLANSNVTNEKLAENSVTSGKIGSGAVSTAKLGDLSVTEGKLADDSVTSAKLAHNLKWADLQNFGTNDNYLEFQNGLDYTVGSDDTHSFMVGATERLQLHNTGGHMEGILTQSSDPKWKDDMQSVMEPALAYAAMDKMHGISWFWKDAAKGPTEESGQRSFGINAEHLQSVLPEAVQYSEDKDGLIVQYNALFSLLIQALKGSRMHSLDLEQRLKKMEEMCGCKRCEEPSNQEE